MKSLLYLLTALLPLTLAMPSAEPDEAGDESLEERDQHKQPPQKQPPWCQSNNQIWYYKSPCPPAGKYDPHERVQYQCQKNNWYRTWYKGNTWWVKGSDVPPNCKNKPNC